MARPKALSRGGVLALAVTLSALALPLVASSARASDARVVVATPVALVSPDRVVHHAISTTLDVALASRNPSGLSSFIASVSNPASRNYHHFLNPTQYAARFGASGRVVAALRRYLTAHGVTVGPLSRGGNILHVRASTTALATAFNARVETVRLSDGTLDAHLLSAATLPSTLGRDVVGIGGLTTVSPEVTNSLLSAHTTTAATCPSAGSSTGTTPNALGGYTAQQQAQLYGFAGAWASGDTGLGQTIGVYELAAYNPGDVATYFNCYGLTPNLVTSNVDGGPTALDNAGSAPDEATLDVEESQVLAPGAHLVVYQGSQSGSGPIDIFSTIASADVATVVTTSWGICEPQNAGAAQAEQPIFEEMAAQGQTVVAAAGDEGSSDCESTSTPTTTLAVDDPASQPLVTGVGGLTVSNTSPLTQSVWNDGCPQASCGAGGGGVSTLWSQPAWQQAPGITTTAATGGMRMVPDLSVMADPSTGFIQYYTGAPGGACTQNCSSGWGNIGGTSIGSPLVSALVAVAAQACGTRLGLINPSLYAMAATGFNDVTSGNNDLFNVGEYSAGIGYDMASGLGSPNGAPFISGLCPAAVSPSLSLFSVTSGAHAGSAGVSVNATLHLGTGAVASGATVTASAAAPGGVVTIDGQSASSTTVGHATLNLASDANGSVTFDVASSLAQRVLITLSAAGTTLYSTTVSFLAVVGPRPEAPSILAITPLSGGFVLTVRAPNHVTGPPITRYQYSLSPGGRWINFTVGTRTVKVTRLRRGQRYRVTVRALNNVGFSAPSPPRTIVTKS